MVMGLGMSFFVMQLMSDAANRQCVHPVQRFRNHPVSGHDQHSGIDESQYWSLSDLLQWLMDRPVKFQVH
jgi:hypothetical protein